MKLHLLHSACTGLACAALLGISAAASAQVAPDTPSLSVVSAGHGKVRLTITAGPSGAPAGFGVWWMTTTRFAAYGNSWPTPWMSGESWIAFAGVGTLNTWGAPTVDFKLAPYQSLDVEVGDSRDESGVSGTRYEELLDGVTYVFCAYAPGAGGGSASPLSVTISKATTPQGQNCTYTQGYWKNHASAWPVTSLKLGTVTYSQAQLLQIFGQPVQGNGLISLAHQLIATKLNIAGGGSPVVVAATILAADALIGGLVVPSIGSGSLSTSSTSSATQTLDDYNNGVTGPGHCGATPAGVTTWSRLKALYR